MKVLRLKLRQNQAAFSREETVDNRMTYPLPPYSTIIGALHNACLYTEYHPMNISVQGKFGAMQKEIYINHGLLNNRHDDRNILIYLENPNMLSTGYISVAEGLKSQGNSFVENKTIRIDNELYYRKFIELENKKLKLNEEGSEVINKVNELKDQEKTLKLEQKELDKDTDEFANLSERIKELRERYRKLDKERKDKFRREYTEPSSHFKTLVKSPSYQEVLYDVELVIHVESDSETVADIQRNINSFTSLGRSEDFIDLIEIKEVELIEAEGDITLKEDYKIYVNVDEILDDNDEAPYFFVDGNNKLDAQGTVYYVNKDYSIEKGKRIFNKIPCLCTSFIGIDGDSGRVIDQDGYIVNLN